MDIKPIRTQRDHKAALAEIERLFDAKPGTPDGDRLEVLATLVEAYEQKHYPVLPPDPVEAILYFMESRGLSRKDLEPYLGGRAKVSEVLNRKRPLSTLRGSCGASATRGSQENTAGLRETSTGSPSFAPVAEMR